MNAGHNAWFGLAPKWAKVTRVSRKALTAAGATLMSVAMLPRLGSAQMTPLKTAPSKAQNVAHAPEKLPELTVSLVPEKPAIILGEPISLTFSVENSSDHALQMPVGGDYRNALGRPDSFKVMVMGDNGQPVPQPDAGFGMGGLVAPQKLPAHGHYDFKLFLPHWATFQFPGTYKISAARTLNVSAEGSDAWEHGNGGTPFKAEASATLRVLPYDAAQMGELIATYGDTMLKGEADAQASDAAQNAARYLQAIHDERVIAYFVKAFARPGYDWKAIALQALTPYNDDAALEVLKRGMAVTATEMTDATTREGSEDLAAGVRQTAAFGLAHSPHPGAYPFLLSQLHDPSMSVRLTVLQAAASHQPPDLTTVKALADDPDTTVRDEAKRYLKELATHK